VNLAHSLGVKVFSHRRVKNDPLTELAGAVSNQQSLAIFRFDLDEVGDFGDYRGRDDDRAVDRRNSAVQASWCRSLALSTAASGPVSAVSISAFREFLAQDLP
jgi:hypothetical protein